MRIWLVLDSQNYPVHAFALKEDAEAFITVTAMQGVWRLLEITVQQ